MIRLFFENQEVELNENIQIAITKQFEDVTNPTSIINDWSKTVKIPSTSLNNRIFGNLYNVDRLTVEGDYKLLGIYFNPYKKINFRLQYGDMIVMTGYAKNISVDKDGYNLTLNGELGKVFQEMKKITFDTATEDTTYLIDGSKYVNETINKDLVYKLWTNEPTYTNSLLETTNTNYKIQDYLGFIPNNSYSEGFDYKIFQMENKNVSKKFSEVLDETAANKLGEGKTYVDATGIAADTVIGEGLLPRDIGEYRSYYQLPYIHFNKLFRIFAKKTEDITGYSVIFDSDWFNADNLYWTNTVYMLKNVYQKSSDKKLTGGALSFGTFTNNGHNSYSPSLAPNGVWKELKNTELNDVYTQFKQGKIDSFSFDSTIPLKISLNNCTVNPNGTGSTLSTKNYVILSTGTAFNVLFRVKDANNNVVYTTPEVVLYTSYSGRWSYENGVVVDYFTKISNGNYSTTVNVPFGITVNRGEVGNDYKIEVAIYSTVPRDDLETILYASDVKGNSITTVPSNAEVITPAAISFVAQSSSVNVDGVKRSNSKITLNDLWNKEYNLFNEILNYCKQFRIGVFCDYVNKRLTFKSLTKYFKDYTIEDWTDKVDYSRDYHIEPITFQNKYILFNYKDDSTELNTKYKEKFGLNYGEYKLTTNYEFNNDTKKLFEHSKTAIPTSDIVLSWSTLYSNLKVGYTLPTEITINNKDKDKKTVELFGNLLFYKGLNQFDTTSGLRSVTLTDDTLFQTLNKTYFYTQAGEASKKIKVETYPVLDIVVNNTLCTYTAPIENYTYSVNNYTDKTGIYNNFWKQYLDERYNIQNKIVTCYMYLKPQEYTNFNWNKFIKINNQLFFVNKIYDYNIDENTPTKVDLITIQDISGYTQNNFKYFYIYNKNGNTYELWDNNYHYVDLNQHSNYTIYITSNKEVNWSTDKNLQDNVEVNGEVGSGVISAGDKVAVTLFNDEYGPAEGYIEFYNGKDTQKIFVRVR